MASTNWLRTTREPPRPIYFDCLQQGGPNRRNFKLPSADVCTHSVVVRKVKDCLALAQDQDIAVYYTDEDGEDYYLNEDGDLRNAIEYFSTYIDDSPAPRATAGGQREIRVVLQVVLHFDSRLSDTASLKSLDDDPSQRPGGDYDTLDLESDIMSQRSFGSIPQMEPEEDGVTISSRDHGPVPRANPFYSHIHSGQSSRTQVGDPAVDFGAGFDDGQYREPSSPHSSDDASGDVETLYHGGSRSQVKDHHVDGDASSESFSEVQFPPSDAGSDVNPFEPAPTSVLERLKESNSSGSQGFHAQWLKDQNKRTIRATVGPTPDSVSGDDLSINLEDSTSSVDLDDGSQVDLSLQQGGRGNYYYEIDDNSSVAALSDTGFGKANDFQVAPRQRDKPLPRPPGPSHQNGLIKSSHSMPGRAMSLVDEYDIPPRTSIHASASAPQLRAALYQEELTDYSNIDPELLEFLKTSDPAPPPKTLTNCSACGIVLDSIRYVCSTCGEKPGYSPHAPHPQSGSSSKGKGRAMSDDAYSSHSGYSGLDTRSQVSDESWVHLNDEDVPLRTFRRHGANSFPGAALTVPSRAALIEMGYELCAGCIESFGRIHAESTPASSPSTTTLMSHSPHSPHSPRSPHSPPENPFAPNQTRTARRKAQMRHAFVEKMWGWDGWKDVEHGNEGTCSTCGNVSRSHRFKCVSCEKFELCRACYSQVQEIHPIHAFLAVPDRLPPPAPPSSVASIPLIEHEEPSMTHPGVTCFHCMQPIVGALFHCAICQSVDICSSCDSAGLPGNMETTQEGGHLMSHIMIKIPRPMNTKVVESVSRRARDRWNKRDSLQYLRPNSPSMESSYAPTVISSSQGSWSSGGHLALNEHGVQCRGCHQQIIGVRYQCASCPSMPVNVYNLCENCEVVSFQHHDPMHIFLRIERPVDRPIASSTPLIDPVYDVPAGQDRSGNRYGEGYREYIETLEHPATVCDHCVKKIVGVWLRCAHCGGDLCEDCYELGAHPDPNHVFLVFKSSVNISRFHQFANLDGPNGSMGVINYPVYNS